MCTICKAKLQIERLCHAYVSLSVGQQSSASHACTLAHQCVTGGPWHAADVSGELCQAGPRGVQAAG